MTLLEIMVTGAVFTMAACGILAMALRSRSDINQSLVRNIAFDTAGSLMDQLKAQKFGVLLQAAQAPSGAAQNQLVFTVNDYAHQGVASVVIPANATSFTEFSDRTGSVDSVLGTPLGDQRVPYNYTSRTGKMIYLNGFAVRLELTPINDTPTGGTNAMLVQIHYRYSESFGQSASGTVERNLTYIHANL